MARTKWEILSERLESAKKSVADLEAQMRWMENTPNNAICVGCGTRLETEKDFAAHFEILDENYLNLGFCPNHDS